MKNKQLTVMRAAMSISYISVMIISALTAIDELLIPRSNYFSNWGGDQAMALPTAACFFLLSSAMFLRDHLTRDIIESLVCRPNEK